MPSLCMAVSIGLAIGVPSGVLRCRPPWSCAVGVPEEHERAAAMVVHVRVGHRRAPDDHRLVEQALVAVHGVLHLVEEVRHLADAVLADLVELERSRASLLPWCDAGWNGWFDPLSGKTRFCASRPVLNEMTRVMSVSSASTCTSNSSFMCSENESGTPAGASRQLARLAAGVARLDHADAALDLAHVVEVAIHAGRGRPRRACRLKLGDLGLDPVEDAAARRRGARRALPACRRRRTACRRRRAGRGSSAAARSATPS